MTIEKGDYVTYAWDPLDGAYGKVIWVGSDWEISVHWIEGRWAGEYKYHTDSFLLKVPCKEVSKSFTELFI